MEDYSLWDDPGPEALRERRRALWEAIASGALKVVFRDREITYQRTSDLLAALRNLDAQIHEADGVPKVRAVLFHTSKGF